MADAGPAIRPASIRAAAGADVAHTKRASAEAKLKVEVAFLVDEQALLGEAEEAGQHNSLVQFKGDPMPEGQSQSRPKPAKRLRPLIAPGRMTGFRSGKIQVHLEIAFGGHARRLPRIPRHAIPLMGRDPRALARAPRAERERSAAHVALAPSGFLWHNPRRCIRSGT